MPANDPSPDRLPHELLSPQRWRRLLELFEIARELPSESREPWVSEQCAEDAELRERLTLMLRHDQQKQSRLDEPLRPGQTLGLHIADGDGTGSDDGDIDGDPLIGKTIGRNRIIRQIGRGGMGVVYEAESEQPARRVALKVIRQGLANRNAIRRFEFEQQILARLQHPGIAQIYEAGTFDLGEGARPYFAMELIEGEPLTTYARKHLLSTTAILKLMIAVCEAVHHAHQRGVIHRDLKPANILVTRAIGSDAGADSRESTSDSRQPTPKVLDFGVAKATDSDLTASTLLTSREHIAGTIRYMSPEQLEGDSQRLSVLTDVYSLGVILYELLAGRLPYDAHTDSIFEIMRQIREQPPARLSSINRRLRGDLETILGKALAKEPQLRYRSAAEMANDLQSFLANEPIAARPPSVLYQLSKFTRRHTTFVAGAALVVILLVGGLMVTSYMYVQTDEARAVAIAARDAELEQRRQTEANEQRALAAEHESRQRADELESLAAFQQRQLAEVDAASMGARIRRDILDAYRKAVETQHTDAPRITATVDEVEASLDLINFTNIALDALRTDVFDRALRTIEEDFSGQPLLQALLYQTVADTLRDLGMLGVALTPQTAALDIRRRKLGEDDVRTLETMNNMAALLRRQGNLAEAEALFRDVLEHRGRVLGREHADTLASINNVAATLDEMGRHADAEIYYREAVAGLRRVMGEEHASTLNAIDNLGGLLVQLGRFDEAEPYHHEAIAVRRRTLGDDHPQTLTSINNLAFMLQSQGKFDEAEPYWHETLDGFRRTFGDDHPGTLTALNNLASLLQRQGRHEEAEPYFRQALASHRRVLGDAHPNTLVLMNNTGVLLRDLGHLTEAERLGAEAVERASQILPDGHWLEATFLGQHARTLLALQRFSEAEERALRSAATFSASLGSEDRRSRRAKELLADLYDAWHQAEPDAGHEQSAAEWRARLPDSRQSPHVRPNRNAADTGN